MKIGLLPLEVVFFNITDCGEVVEDEHDDFWSWRLRPKQHSRNR